MKRQSVVERKTKETAIRIELDIDDISESSIQTGVPFFDHMLMSMSKHGRFHVNLTCTGDTEIDDHHSVEDIGIALGSAFKQALGDKAGIYRFGDVTIPMDDTLTMVAVDLSGRPYFQYQGPVLNGSVGRYNEELTDEFLRAFAMNGGINLHVHVYYGTNRHHIHETIFKALGIALFKAVTHDPRMDGGVLSTKGTIT